MDIALKIKELIEEKKISITDFADKLDVSRNTVYNFLGKKHPIDVELLQKISQILDVPIITFFGIEDPKLNEELLKTIEKQNEYIRSLKRKLYIIESTNYSIKGFYLSKFKTLNDSIIQEIESNSQFNANDSLILAALDAILNLDKDPDRLIEYSELLRRITESELSQPVIDVFFKGGTPQIQNGKEDIS